MTDLKPGDKVNWEGAERVIVAVDGKTAWTRLADFPEAMGRLLPLDNLKKIEPFFEAGKTYDRSGGGPRFDVEKTGEDSDGPVAVGMTTYPHSGRGYWTVRHVFDGWTEVAE